MKGQKGISFCVLVQEWTLQGWSGGLEPVPQEVKVVASGDPIFSSWLWLSVFKQSCLRYPVFFLPTLYNSPLLTLAELVLYK